MLRPFVRRVRILWQSCNPCVRQLSRLTPDPANRRRRKRSLTKTIPVNGSNIEQEAEHDDDETRVKNTALLRELFPLRREDGALHHALREVPRLPLNEPFVPVHTPPQQVATDPSRSEKQRDHEDQMRKQGERTAVLVVRNVSKSLLEEDFYSLIAKGKHIEGWTLQEGDIVKG